MKSTPLTAPDGCEVIADAVAVPKVKLKELDVTAVSEVGVNVNVNGPAVPVSRKLVNVATPATAARVVVPDNVPVPVAIVATTLTVELVTVLPFASTILTTGCPVKSTPLTAPDGWVVIAEADAAPNVKVNDDDVTAVSAVGVNVKVKGPAVPVIRKLVNVATPATAARVVVPDNVPVPVAIVATTFTVELVTVLPLASTILTTG